MRYMVCMLGLVAVTRLFSGCDPREAGTAAPKPRLLAAGNLNDLYVVRAQGDGDAAAFRFWQRDARGTWHGGSAGQGAIAAACAWRGNLLVFFPSGRYGLFGLEKPLIQPSPVPAWAPAAVCEDGLAADAFGWNAAGEPVAARHEDGKWSWRRVDADLKRGKVLGPVLVRFSGRLYLVWREEEPTLTGAAPNFRLWFAYQDKEGWRAAIKSRLYVASAPSVAATSSTMACVFLKAQGDGKPGQWTLATYATADEDWHEMGPVTGTLPAGPLVLVQSGQAFHLAALEGDRPLAAALDASAARAGPFFSFAAEEKTAKPPPDYGSVVVFGLASLALILLLASWQKARRAAGLQAVRGAPVAGQAARTAEQTRGSETAPYVPAPLFKRGVAVLIDYLLLGFVMAPVMLQFVPDLRTGALVGPDLMLNMSLQEMAIVQGIYLVACLVYFTVTEGLFGRTLGKRLMGLRVRGETGAPITLRQAFVRNLLRSVDEFPALYVLGLLSIVVGPRPQRLGDRVARTLVVVDVPAKLQRPPQG